MKNITPYLKSLNAFEATARHQSFSAAAKELFVTPAAVGQLVKQLENQLGVKLFQRTAGGQQRLALTNAAKNALPDVQTGLVYLAKGLAALKNEQENQTLALAVSPAFASKWLLRRLEQFYAIYPNLAIRLHTDPKPIDFIEQNIDIGIRYGGGKWAGLLSEKLFDETLFPVCSPALAARFQNPIELTHATLIHDSTMDASTGFISWQQWFAAAKIPVAMLKQGLRLDNSALVLQAAIDRQGVALARSIMAKDDLENGKLVRLFPEIDCLTSLAYYLVFPAEKAEWEKVRVFREWIKTT